MPARGFFWIWSPSFRMTSASCVSSMDGAGVGGSTVWPVVSMTISVLPVSGSVIVYGCATFGGRDTFPLVIVIGGIWLVSLDASLARKAEYPTCHLANTGTHVA